MYKRFTLILTLPILLLGLQFASAADTDHVLVPGSEPVPMEILYKVDPSYTVTIPASVNIDKDGTGTAQLKIDAGPVTEEGESVAIFLQASASHGKAITNEFALFAYEVYQSTTPHVIYKIFANDQSIEAPSDTQPLLIQSSGADTAAILNLRFETQGNPSAVGKYKDKLTFGVHTGNF